jgi:drug/metabolite transporter (DMT)-like permease
MKTKTGEKQVTPTGLMHLGVIYLVWSSTYLAIRIAVREGSGFPPFTSGLMRVLVAGSFLLAWAWLQKKRIKPTRRELAVLAGSGLLLWTGGNGMVVYAEQRADSGLAALLIAAIPIWSALIEAVIDRRWPSRALAGSLFIGFVGVGFLAAPSMMTGIRADLLSILALLVAAFSWACGSVLQARNPVKIGPVLSSAYQMLTGSLGFIVLVWLAKEPRPTPAPDAWLAWGYLVVFGTLAFISYVTVLQVLPTRIVMTYAYVNPVLALALGWLVLGEKITGWTLAGSALVLLGVWGVFRERYRV